MGSYSVGCERRVSIEAEIAEMVGVLRRVESGMSILVGSASSMWRFRVMSVKEEMPRSKIEVRVFIEVLGRERRFESVSTTRISVGVVAECHCEARHDSSAASLCFSYEAYSPLSNAALAFVLEILPNDDFSRSSFGSGIRCSGAFVVIIATTFEIAVAISNLACASSGLSDKSA